ncbi:MAG: hypothetical protein NT098_05055 [Candidatus Parcubacteria bacterium]|nr:hypothetical protein [Candidatus Parcubacteria bacterium]
MNETTKNILLEQMDGIFLLLSSLLETDPLVEEISSVTDPGNLRAVFSNMKFFLENGTVPKSGEGYSNLPAIVFGLPALQDYLIKEFGEKISPEEIRGLGQSYLDAYKKLNT